MTFTTGVCSFAALAVAGSALAAPIGPGGTLFLAPAEPMPGGALVSPVLNLPFATGFYSGTLTSYVLAGDPTNPLGGLTFVYVVTNNAGSAHSLGRLTVNGYAGFGTDASYVAATGIDPLFIDRQANGDSLGFSFSNAMAHSLIIPGGMSSVLVIQTDASQFRLSIANVINGAVTQVDTWAPAVPTPGAAALAGLGFLAAGRRRR